METIKYYVDESGELGLFNRKGQPLNTSRTIMLGFLKIKEGQFEQKFDRFRFDIIDDPIFKTFPSHEKTRQAFHAKDDHIAVKREVFKFIKNLDLSVQVVVRRRSSLVEHARSIFENYKRKYSHKQLYNDLVTRLFKRNLHKEDCYEVYFSHRGNTTENKAISEALEKAKKNFYDTYGIHSKSDCKIICKHPSEEIGLQLIDYCLWALQRFYEKNEDVYFKMIEDKFKLIVDVDDKRNNAYGEFYTQNNRITLERIRG